MTSGVSMRTEREQQLETMLAVLPDVVCMYDRSLRYEYASPAIERVTGIPVSDFIGKTHAEIGFPPEMVELFDTSLRGVFETGTATPIEFSFCPAKETRHYVGTAIPLFEQGQIAKIVTITRDITDFKHVEETVREQQQDLIQNEERLRNAIKVGNIGVWDWDIPGGKVTWSENVYKFHGLTPETFDGSIECFVRCIHPDDVAHVNAAIQNCLRTGEPYSVKFRVVWADSTVHWLTTDGTVLFQDGKPFRMLGATADITEQHGAMHRLELLTQRLQRAQEAAKVATWEWDRETGILEWSENANDVFGGARSHGIAEFLSRVHPADLPAVVAATKNVDQGPNEVQYRVTNSDGAVKWLLTRARAVDERFVCGATLDITTGKLAEDALIRSEKLAATGRLAATIAHEVNNPLEAVLNLLYLLKTNDSLNDEARGWAQQADEELQRVAHLTRQTLAYYKGGGSAKRLEMKTIVDQVMSLYIREAQKKSVRVETDVEPVKLSAVEGEVRQVLSNLLANAIDAAPLKGTVRLTCHEDSASGSVIVTVEDSGTGVPERDCARIFEPFFTTKKEFGTGLGLWVTRDLVQRWGGTVTISRSPALGGAQFRVQIPV